MLDGWCDRDIKGRCAVVGIPERILKKRSNTKLLSTKYRQVANHVRTQLQIRSRLSL